MAPHRSNAKKNQGQIQIIEEALAKIQQASEQIKDGAGKLMVVLAVLDTQISHGAAQADLEEAVARTRKIEQRLNESAETLDAANAILERAANA